MDRVRVREVTVADVPAVVDVHVRARSAYYTAGGVAAETSLDPEALARRERVWADGIAAPDMPALCAEAEDGEILGVVAWGSPHDDAEACRQLFLLHVRPDSWGRGVGGALHRAFTDAVTAAGFDRAVLEVWDANTRARGFYVRRGWRPDGTRRPGPGDVDYVGLRLTISRPAPAG